MRIRSIFFASLIFAGIVCNAQDSVQVKQHNLVPRHAIKFSPLHLMSFYPTIQLAYEFKVHDFWTVQLDGGVVVDTEFNTRFTNKRGFKLKLEPRHYIGFSEKRNVAFYVAFEFYYNNIDFDRTDTQTECFDLGCMNRFTRKYTYTTNYDEKGLAVKIGLVKYSKHFLFDVNTGFGFRLINYTVPPYIIEDFDNEWYRIPRIKDRNVFTPFIANLRLGYRFL